MPCRVSAINGWLSWLKVILSLLRNRQTAWVVAKVVFRALAISLTAAARGANGAYVV